jgi:hypothetical protein
MSLRSDMKTPALGKMADWTIGTLTAFVWQFEQKYSDALNLGGWRPDYAIAPGNYTFRKPPYSDDDLQRLRNDLSQKQEEAQAAFHSGSHQSVGPMELSTVSTPQWLNLEDISSELSKLKRFSIVSEEMIPRLKKAFPSEEWSLDAHEETSGLLARDIELSRVKRGADDAFATSSGEKRARPE